jgi:Na+-driven multidrug efflux pump
MAFATICYEFFPQYIVLIFGSGSSLYEQFSIKTFRIFLCLSVLNGFQTCSAILFQAIGAPIKSMVVSISRQVLFYVPMMLIMSSFMGLEGILWAGPIGDILAFLLALVLVIFQFMKFKKMEVIHGKT